MRVRPHNPAQVRVGNQHALQLGQVGEGGVAGEHGVHQPVEHERVEREHDNHNGSEQALVVQDSTIKAEHAQAWWWRVAK